jgi:hypothetical protein
MCPGGEDVTYMCSLLELPRPRVEAGYSPKHASRKPMFDRGTGAKDSSPDRCWGVAERIGFAA